MVYVITGGPGFGKTTLINYLSEQNYPVGKEAARALLLEKYRDRNTGNSSFPPADFERVVAMERLNFLTSVDPDTIAFADRGLPDQIAYSWFRNKVPSTFIEETVRTNKYAPSVFMTPPWKEIYIQDQVRIETYEEALEIHQYIVRAYLEYGYKIVNLPMVNPESRIQFIMNFLGI